MYPVAGPNRDWLLSAMDTYRRTAIVLRYWCDMTIAMAAFAGPSKIVTVSDARLSYNEMVPAEDAATMKSRQIARKWGLMFAAEDSTAFTPLVEKAVRQLSDNGKGNPDPNHSYADVKIGRAHV